MIPAFLVMLYAQSKVSSAYNKYSRIANAQGITGAEAARRLLWANGLEHVKIEGTKGKLTDHYDPRKKVLRLSKDIANNASVAALGIVAHEVGHAIQDKVGYMPLKVRGGLVPVANLGSQLGFICFFIGFLIYLFSGYQFGVTIATVGVILFAAVVLFTLVTLPVEYNASNRARNMLKSTGMVSTQEYDGASAVLSAAALTYVAAALQALAQLLFFVLLLFGMRR
jgi:hypothetical protein